MPRVPGQLYLLNPDSERGPGEAITAWDQAMPSATRAELGFTLVEGAELDEVEAGRTVFAGTAGAAGGLM